MADWQVSKIDCISQYICMVAPAETTKEKTREVISSHLSNEFRLVFFWTDNVSETQENNAKIAPAGPIPESPK